MSSCPCVSEAPVQLRGASVRRLALTQFRNHPRLDLELDGRPVCLIGPNGAGKTNVLEALTTLGAGRGLRSAELADMCREGEDGGPWAVAAGLDVSGVAVRIGVGAEVTPQGGWRRVARMDGRAATPAQLADQVRLVWLTPAMDRLFAGPAGERRRFLDRLAASVAPAHAEAASAYERAMRERQKLLDDGETSGPWLDGLEHEAAAHGAAVAAGRIDAIDALQAAIDARPDGPFPKADLAIEGGLEAAIRDGSRAGALEDAFAARLRSVRPRDAAAGRALDGPHRSDFSARHRAKDRPAADCSTGEQKALVVGLALAHARRLADSARAANPLLLLDEACAHLDAERRAALAGELLSLPGQAWLTGVETQAFDAFGAGAQRFEIAAGIARPL
jgi:DNA replication and repair protein RecF